MDSRPAKRQRKATVVLSEDDEPVSADIPVRTPKKQTQFELGTQTGSPLTLSPNRVRATRAPAKKTAKKDSIKGSPQQRKKASPSKEPDKSKSLHTFFGKATEEQRWHRKSETPEEDIIDREIGDDIVDDDISDDALLSLEGEQSTSTRHVLDRRKEGIKKASATAVKSNGFLLSSSQRFVKPTIPDRQRSAEFDAGQSGKEQEQHRPWADRYGPANIEELAVHKKKVQDVQKWLDTTLSGRDRQRLLLLKGPAGSGKSTTISLLSKSLGFQLVPWQNPDVYDAAVGGSVAAQFDDFLNRGGQFSTLSFGNSSYASSASGRPVLLVEEFPSTMTRSSGIDSFRTIILQFLARSNTVPAAPFRSQSTSLEPHPPLIMIVSETLLSSSTAFSDSFTAHRLLGPEILNHPLVTVIDFNPIAPTFISKALDTVIKKEARDSNRRRAPGPAVLARLAEMGDVRSAVNTLEFLCVRNNEADWSGTVAAKPKKLSKDANNMTEMEKNSLELVSRRETTLDMFHAAGKIVYNKREDPRILDSQAEQPPKPPDHLMYLYSPKVSQVDIEALLNETGTDIQTFISTLHENYVLSCNGESFIDSLDSCSNTLSISDVLNPDSRRQLRSKSNTTSVSQSMPAGSSDTLRQDEISFNVATRGLLFNLPYPVNRGAPSSGRKADSFKMFYPASLRLWKPTEEIDALISIYARNISAAGPADSGGQDGVASWKSHPFGAQPHASSSSSSSNDEEASLARTVPSTRDELTLEILPYLSLVQSARKQDIKTLNQITQFHGMGVPTMSGDEPDDEELKEETIVRAEKVGASRFADWGAAAKGQGGMGIGIGKKESVSDVAMEKLFLENDDIVDD